MYLLPVSLPVWISPFKERVVVRGAMLEVAVDVDEDVNERLKDIPDDVRAAPTAARRCRQQVLDLIYVKIRNETTKIKFF